MEQYGRQRLFAGLALIVLGSVLFVLNRAESIGQTAIFFLVGGALLAGYLYRRVHGLLIPACILLGLGTGTTGLFRFGDSTLLGLGSGFIAIFVIALLYERRKQWWPLIPGTILILAGLPWTEEILDYLLHNWPLILIIVGLLILLGAFGRPRRKRDAV